VPARVASERHAQPGDRPRLPGELSGESVLSHAVAGRVHAGKRSGPVVHDRIVARVKPGPVLPDRAGEREPDVELGEGVEVGLVVPVDRRRSQAVVAEEREDLTLEPVAARRRHHVHHAAERPSVFCLVAARLDLDRLEKVVGQVGT